MMDSLNTDELIEKYNEAVDMPVTGQENVHVRQQRINALVIELGNRVEKDDDIALAWFMEAK